MKKRRFVSSFFANFNIIRQNIEKHIAFSYGQMLKLLSFGIARKHNFIGI